MEAVVDLVHQVALGLEAVHDAGIVHRDLKPQNIFCSETPRGQIWKILDFGVSKMEAAGMTLTENQVVGTPAYMSPEQARGDDLDARSDIFTLSAVVYRCLTGRSPFAARRRSRTYLRPCECRRSWRRKAHGGARTGLAP